MMRRALFSLLLLVATGSIRLSFSFEQQQHATSTIRTFQRRPSSSGFSSVSYFAEAHHYSPSPVQQSSKVRCFSHRLFFFKSSGGGQEKDDNEKKTSERLTLDELARREQAADKRIRDSMLLPFRLGRAINFLGWSFLISIFVLEYFGYGYMKNPDGPGVLVVTLEERAFQSELRRSVSDRDNRSLEPASRSVHPEVLLQKDL